MPQGFTEGPSNFSQNSKTDLEKTKLSKCSTLLQKGQFAALTSYSSLATRRQQPLALVLKGHKVIKEKL